MKNDFTIDFFELSFLAVACIPPRPISRAMFWGRLCGKIYNSLSKEQRKLMFEWITREDAFDKDNEECLYFYNRYNPDNQYLVKTSIDRFSEVECFKHNGKFVVSKTMRLNEEYILEVTKL